jgi:hypothetical protein
LVLGVVLLYLLSVTFVVVAAAGNDKSKSDDDNNNKKETCQEDGTCVEEDVVDAATTNAAADTAATKIEDKANATTTNDTNSVNCRDEDSESNCFVWAVAGECEKNPAYMRQKCQKSCGICNGGYVCHIMLL